jgi:hypothetical protein
MRNRRSSTDTFAPETIPIMMYSAINLRPHFQLPPPPASFMFLALAYFNVVLPAFLPRSTSLPSAFWHRARLVKAQKHAYINSPMLVSRTQEMNKARCRRAKTFAKEDDEVLRRQPQPPIRSATPSPAKSHPAGAPQAPQAPPSAALLGLSMLGNLDEIYNGERYPTIQLTQATGVTRKGKGGILMMSHTFRKRFYITLSWDTQGFSEGVVEEFWSRVQSGLDEFLVRGFHAGHRL